MTSTRRVDPQLYTKEYYLQACTGYAIFNATHGSILEPRLAMVAQFAPSWHNQRVLDIGCGRGELVFHTVRHGARFAVGIDYSPDGIAISQDAQTHQPQTIKKKTRFFTADAKKLPFAASSFDYIFFTEVWEHVYPEEVDTILAEVHRVLTPGGKLIIHTAPTHTFNNFTYPLWCYPMSSMLVLFYKLLTGKSYPNLLPPKDIRGSYELEMHVNETTHFSVYWQLFKHGFNAALFSTNQTVNKPILSWKDTLFNFFVYLSPLSRYFPFNLIWGNDIFAVAHKKA